MDVDVLKVSETWSFWDGDLPHSLPRRVSLPHELRDSLCLVVQGVRRCGKSTLLQQLVTRYGLDPGHCAFLNLEDPRLSNALSHELLDQLVRRFREKHSRAERLYFFLDEIQRVDGWQRWLRAQLDRPRGNVFVITGSNAKLLSGELSTVLTGRHLSIELYPFDLQELRLQSVDVALQDYLHLGGFPEPWSMHDADADRLRRQYFDDIIERDIRERLGARSCLPIRQVAQMAFEATGSEMSLRRVAGAVGIAVETAGSYLSACEAAYLLFCVPYFAFSERKRAARNRKYYPVDTGLRRAVVTTTGRDLGKSLECAAHLALRKRHGPDTVYYWRGRGEVDFVVHHERRIIPLQVTWEAPLERHEAALTEFYETFPQAEEALIITPDSFEDLLLA